MALTETRLDKIIGMGSGTGSRPAAGQTGARWIDTTGPTESYDNGAAWVNLVSGGATLYSSYLCFQDQKTAGTDGGTFTSGAWQTRNLNIKVADTASHGSVASNQITLDPGTYRVQVMAPCMAVDRHQARLQNITDSTTLVTGSGPFTASGVTIGVFAVILGRFTIAAVKVIEVQHQCQTTRATTGFGINTNTGFTVPIEVYTTIELWKE